MTNINSIKVTSLILAFGLMASCSRDNDYKSFGLNGKVKTFLEHEYEAEMKFGEWEIGVSKYYNHSKVYFDKDGNYQWIDDLDDDNNLFRKLIPKRENGEIIVENYYDADGKLISKTKIIRNSKDEKEFIQYDKDGIKTTQGKSHFAKNRVIKQQYQNFEDSKIKEEFTVVFEYDKDGNLISQKKTDKNGAISYSFTFKYLAFDEKNNWIKRHDYDSEKETEKPDKIVIRKFEYY